jgi:excisionase family DNA binding protein
MKAAKLRTPREAAVALGISYATLKRWVRDGKIRTIKTAGGHHRLPESEVDRYLYRAVEEGSHGGNTSVCLTPGIVLGRFKIHNRFAFAIGGGYEIAVTSFHPTNHIAIASVRLPF